MTGHDINEDQEGRQPLQGFGCMLVIDLDTGAVRQASSNAAQYFSIPVNDLIGADVRETLGQNICHDIRNAAASPQFTTRSTWVGQVQIDGADYAISAFASGENAVLELEPDTPETDDLISVFSTVFDQVLRGGTAQDLLDKTVEYLRFMTGYDQVFLCEHRGENHSALRASSGGTPPDDHGVDLRELGGATLRIIADATATPVTLTSKPDDTHPIAIGAALLRGVSDTEQAYMAAAGVTSMMTYPIVLKDFFDGTLVFRSDTPKRPSATLRRQLETILPMIQLRLETLLTAARLHHAAQVEQISTTIEENVTRSGTLTDALTAVADELLQVFDGESLAYLAGEDHKVLSGPITLEVIQKISEALPDNTKKSTASGDLNGAPYLSITLEDGQRFVLLRSPNAPPWRDQHLSLAARLQQALIAAERARRIFRLEAERSALLDEVNLKVRNSMSVIRAVARHARKDNVSTGAYAAALEGRIRILSDVHGFGSDAAKSRVHLKGIIEAEAAAQRLSDQNVIRIDGCERLLKPDAAPLIALVIHELMTNATQFGALSVPDGRVDVGLSAQDGGFALTWQETGGPPVNEPTETGFGARLVRDAVSFEFGGETTLDFCAEGVHADLWLPERVFQAAPVTSSILPDPRPLKTADISPHISASEKKLRILVVEDNFMIAMDVCGALRELGFGDVSVASSVRQAMELIAGRLPDLAVLDINLSNDTTSFAVAEQLRAQNTPFVFMTGYGENIALPQGLRDADILAKPLSPHDLVDWILRVIRQKPKRTRQIDGPLLA